MSAQLRLAVTLFIALACDWIPTVSAQQVLPPPVQFNPPQVPYDPTSPLPPGTVIEPSGPVYRSPIAMPGNSVLIPPLDAEVVWCQLVNVTDDFFKIQSEQRVVTTIHEATAS